MNPLNAPLQAVPSSICDFSLMSLLSYHMKSHNTFCEICGLTSGKLISITRHIDAWSYLTISLARRWFSFFGGGGAGNAGNAAFNTASFLIGLTKIISYGMLMQHDCVIASCNALTYLSNHTKLDHPKTFQPGGNLIMVLNAVQRNGTSVLLWPGVRARRRLMWALSSHLALSFLLQEGFLPFWPCLCSGRLVGTWLRIPGSQPAAAHRCQVASLEAIRFSAVGRCVVKGVWSSAGLLGAKGGKRRGSGFGHPEWLVESHKLLQNSLAISSRALRARS